MFECFAIVLFTLFLAVVGCLGILVIDQRMRREDAAKAAQDPMRIDDDAA